MQASAQLMSKDEKRSETHKLDKIKPIECSKKKLKKGI